MRVIVYTTCLLCITILFGSCGKVSVYEQKTKTLDSLSGAINSSIKEIQSADTITLQKAIQRYSWYKQFVEQNVNDTITKEEADNLQKFYTSGKTLENFSSNRKVILTRAVLINSQIVRLSDDIKNKAINEQQLQNYSSHEKEEAGKLIETAYHQQKLFHSSLEEFKNSLRGVESLIKSRNKGELPTIIKDTITL